MRLVKLPELKALPAGTLFAALQQEWVFGDLEIKGDSFDSDFWVRSLNWIEAYDCGEAVNRLDAMVLDSTISYPIEQAYRRNCDYDDESLYLVYEPDDVAFLVGELGLAPGESQCLDCAEGTCQQPAGHTANPARRGP